MLRTGRNLLCLVVSALLAACDVGDPGQPPSISGTVLGGQAPIVGATVQLKAAGQPPYSARVLASTTTDANGNFDLGTGTCSPSDLLYLTATGGNPGAGANSAISLMTLVGPCAKAGRAYTINELTTVAAAYSANRFIGPAGCVDCAGGAPADVGNISGSAPGLPNAFGTAPRLVDPGLGTLSNLPDATACNAASPPVNCTTSRRLGSLANALAACVNTSGPTSSQCVQLFNCSVAGASAASTTACNLPAGATAPTETLSALLSIARNPVTVAKAGVYYTATRNVVFSPSLTSAPSDWAVSRTLTGVGLNSPMAVAVDAQGNVWVANQSSMSKFGPDGIALSPGNGFTGGGINSAFEMAIDPAGNVWTTDLGNYLSEFSPSGTPLSPSGGYTGCVNLPGGIAFDGSGNAWVASSNNNVLCEFANSGSPVGAGFSGGGLFSPDRLAITATGVVWISDDSGTLSAFNSNGSAISPSGGYSGGGLSGPEGVAVDPAGNIWAANHNSGTLAKFSASGTALSGTGFTGGGLNSPIAIAIDAAGTVWTGNGASSAISEHSPTGSAISPSSGFTSDGVNGARGIAIDPSGNVWAAGYQSNTLMELIGAATPTRTPLVSILSEGFAP
jgi:streptogramin lyase